MGAIKTVPSISTRWRRLSGCMATLATVVMCAGAELPASLEYQVGDQVEADIITPIPLVVFDPVRTEQLRQAEARQIPPVFRYQPAAFRQAEADLQASFNEHRNRFTSGLERLFNHPLPLLTSELGQPSFAEFVKGFRTQNPAFPLNDNVAELWALGDAGDIALERLLARMRRLTNSLVRADALPAGENMTAGMIKLITVEAGGAAPAPATIEKQARVIALTNLIPLSRLRQSAQQNAPANERAEWTYLTGFLRPNCFFDAELTRQIRAPRLEAINAADRYEAGQRLVRQGEVITARAKLALDELHSRTAADRMQANAVAERHRMAAEAASAQRAAEATLTTNRWLLAGLGLTVAGILALAVFLVLRRRALLHAPVPASSALAVRRMDDEDWRERALAAEARADKATAMLRSNMLPQMARWMMGEFMQRLLSNRSEILTSQQRAEREVAELAERLENVHAPLEERLRAYEKRIAELEAELAAKGEQNQELIKARIESTRKQLEGERETMTWSQ